MKPFYLDIETIPGQAPRLREEFVAAVKAPGQYKKPESIAQWLAENAEAEGNAAWLNTSFDGGLGQIVSIGYALGEEMPHCYGVGDLSESSERQIIEEFFLRAVVDADPSHYVGHNIIGFDLPFIWKRCMVLNIKPPAGFPRAPKPWSEHIVDTMLLWDSTQRAGGSMDRICKLLGIDGKGDFGGADVWPAIQRGEFRRVHDYCCGDIQRTRAMHKRMTFSE